MTASTLLAINNYYYPRGGAEVVFLEQNRLLEASGWNVVPFSMHHPDNLESRWSEHFIDEIEFSNPYPWHARLRMAQKVVYSFEARRKLAGLLEVVSPDVCHLHNIYHHISPSILGLLRQRGIPSVMTLHDLKIACPAYKMLAPDGICERCKGGRLANVIRHKCLKGSRALSALIYLESRLHRWLDSYASNLDRLVVPSLFFRQKFTEWGVPADKLHYLPNFVNPAAYRPAESIGDYFVYFGRLAPEKGLETLILAAGAAKVRLRIIGTGPEEDALHELVRRTGAPVEFLGYRTGEDLKRLVGGARATVLPSEWYENAPVSVLESCALGVPLIGADIGGIPEMIRDGETGATFPSGSADALAAQLARFAGMPDRDLRRMKAAARQLVQAEYSADVYQRRLLDLYRELGVRC